MSTIISFTSHFFKPSIKDLVELMMLNHLPIDLCQVEASENFLELVCEFTLTKQLVLPKKWDEIARINEYIMVTIR